MKRLHSLTVIALTGMVGLSSLCAPLAARASEEGKKNTAIGLTQKNKLPGLIAAGGAAYAYSQYEKDRRNHNRYGYRYGDDRHTSRDDYRNQDDRHRSDDRYQTDDRYRTNRDDNQYGADDRYRTNRNNDQYQTDDRYNTNRSDDQYNQDSGYRYRDSSGATHADRYRSDTSTSHDYSNGSSRSAGRRTGFASSGR
jgi:hypothetical protein